MVVENGKVSACGGYIDALIREIHLVGKQTCTRKAVTSLYFGGGTPALAASRMAEIIRAAEEHFRTTDGIGAELHPDMVYYPFWTARSTQVSAAGFERFFGVPPEKGLWP